MDNNVKHLNYIRWNEILTNSIYAWRFIDDFGWIDISNPTNTIKIDQYGYLNGIYGFFLFFNTDLYFFSMNNCNNVFLKIGDNKYKRIGKVLLMEYKIHNNNKNKSNYCHIM